MVTIRIPVEQNVEKNWTSPTKTEQVSMKERKLLSSNSRRLFYVPTVFSSGDDDTQKKATKTEQALS